MNELTIEPIAYIKTDFPEKFGVPRQSGRVQSLTAKITFTEKYNDKSAIRGIEGFSHLWLIFGFSLCKDYAWSPTVRPPRLGGNTRIGVFASRSPFRPNNLGLSSVKLLSITEDNELLVSGADLVNGTPIYDIKPYLPFSDSHPDALGGFADQHLSHKLEIQIDEQLLSIIPNEKKQALIDCLAEDPRPSYQNDEREYGMKFCSFNVLFMVQGKILKVKSIEKLKS